MNVLPRMLHRTLSLQLTYGRLQHEERAWRSLVFVQMTWTTQDTDFFLTKGIEDAFDNQQICFLYNKFNKFLCLWVAEKILSIKNNRRFKSTKEICSCPPTAIALPWRKPHAFSSSLVVACTANAGFLETKCASIKLHVWVWSLTRSWNCFTRPDFSSDWWLGRTWRECLGIWLTWYSNHQRWSVYFVIW